MDVTLHAAEVSTSWLGHVATIIQAVAWPIAFAFVAFLFRRPISSRISEMSEFSAGPVKAMFSRGLAAVSSDLKATAEATPKTEAAPHTVHPPADEKAGSPPPPIQAPPRNREAAKRRMPWGNEGLGSFLEHDPVAKKWYGYGVGEIRPMEAAPEQIVLRAWDSVEAKLQEVAFQRQIMLYGTNGQISLLAEHGHIAPELKDALNGLYELRNLAAHMARAISKAEAKAYVQEAEKAIAALDGSLLA